MRPNQAGNKHPHGSKEVVKRLVVVDPVTQPHRKIGKSDVGCSLLATVPVPTVRRREKKKFGLGTCKFCPPTLHRLSDGNQDSHYMIKQGGTMIQLVGKQPSESNYYYFFLYEYFH